MRTIKVKIQLWCWLTFATAALVSGCGGGGSEPIANAGTIGFSAGNISASVVPDEGMSGANQSASGGTASAGNVGDHQSSEHTAPQKWQLTITNAGHVIGTVVDLPVQSVPNTSSTAENWCLSGLPQATSSGAVTSGTLGADLSNVPCVENKLVVSSVASSTFTSVDSLIYSLKSFQGCGGCDIGSRVVVIYDVERRHRTIPSIPFADYFDRHDSTSTYLRTQ